MKSFMLTGVHRGLMRKLLDWCDEASVVHWMQDGTEPPTWPEAYTRIRQEGRRSKVNHPSAGQTSFDFPEPHLGPSSEVRMK